MFRQASRAEGLSLYSATGIADEDDICILLQTNASRTRLSMRGRGRLQPFTVLLAGITASPVCSSRQWGEAMEFVTGEVAPNPSGVMRYKIVFKRHGAVLSEWPVNSITEGEKQIAEVFRSIGKTRPAHA
jgi:hypothetical protein